MRALDGTVKEFNSTGLWIATRDRNGNTTSGVYNGVVLQQVNLPDGRRFDYTSRWATSIHRSGPPSRIPAWSFAFGSTSGTSITSIIKTDDLGHELGRGPSHSFLRKTRLPTRDSMSTFLPLSRSTSVVCMLALGLALASATGAWAGDTGSVEEDPAATSPCVAHSEVWSELLRCVAGGGEEHCGARLREVRDNYENPGLRKLASTLLDEASLASDDPAVTRPRLIWSPELTLEEIRSLIAETVEWTLILLRGRVDAEGRVHDPEVVRPSQSRKLDRRLIEIFSESCYRPSRDFEDFVSAETHMSLRLDPR